ncbi:uncharacterized protein LOC106640922 [Copidosoma floridanum]|uniref:uncharacterized protein LOC106640922 n=1 Tax=Copidosoma floridanum TaxID=29053 RepID=UPI0006C9E2B4|nr:uncharacterized protein LOC106640922 [Copidosoma floridanum]
MTRTWLVLCSLFVVSLVLVTLDCAEIPVNKRLNAKSRFFIAKLAGSFERKRRSMNENDNEMPLKYSQPIGGLNDVYENPQISRSGGPGFGSAGGLQNQFVDRGQQWSRVDNGDGNNHNRAANRPMNQMVLCFVCTPMES